MADRTLPMTAAEIGAQVKAMLDASHAAMAHPSVSLLADRLEREVQALYEATQQAAVSAPVVTIARELRARINPVAADSAPGQGSPRTASSKQPCLGDPAGLAAQGFDQGAAPSTSAPPADVDALPTTPSSQALQPRGETP